MTKNGSLPTPGPVNIPEGAPVRVLVVDRDSRRRQVLVALMASMGWQCVVVETADSGLPPLLSASPPRYFDFAVVDADAPDFTGYDDLAKQGCSGHQVLRVTNALTCDQREGSSPPAPTLGEPVDAAKLFNAAQQILAQRPGRARCLLEQTVASGCGLSWLQAVRVMVVDDSTLNLKVACKLLESEGAQVKGCTSGPEALIWLQDAHAPVDVVLMDLCMPDMDGFETVRRMRTMDGTVDVPIFALTAAVTEQEQRLCMAVGMNGWLAKPIDRLSVITALHSVVRDRGGRALEVHMRRAGVTAASGHVPSGNLGIEQEFVADALQNDPALHLSLLKQMLAEFSGVASLPQAALPAQMHKLRGGALTLGAKPLADAALALEAALRAGDDAAVCVGRARVVAQMQALAHHVAPHIQAQARREAEAVATALRQSAEAGPPSAADLGELSELITRQSTQARRMARALQPALIFALGAEQERKLQTALAEFDFQQAGRILSGLAESAHAPR